MGGWEGIQIQNAKSGGVSLFPKEHGGRRCYVHLFTICNTFQALQPVFFLLMAIK